MPDSHKNFSYSTVATAPSPATSGTSLVVAAADGTKFPTVPFNATVWPAATQPTSTNAEVVRVTTISTDTFTITRAQESSSARTVVVGDQIAATVTAKTLTDVEGDVALKAPLASPTFTGTATAAALTATGATTLGSTGQATIDASGNISTTGTLQGAATTATGVLTAQSSVALATSALGTKAADYNICTVANATTITLNLASINYRAVKIAPTVTMQTAPGVSGTVVGLRLASTLQGNTGATDTFSLGLFTGILSADTITTQDTNSRSLLSYAAFAAIPGATVFSGGSLTIGTFNYFSQGSFSFPLGTTLTAVNGLSIAGLATGGTCTTFTGVNIQNPTVSGGTFTTMVGVDIAQLTRATTNIGFRNAGSTVLTPVVCTVTSNAGTVPVTIGNAKLTNSSAATITVTMAVTNAVDGQITDVRIYDATGASQTLTWVNTETGKTTPSATTFGSTTIPTHNRFMFNSATSKWTCIGL